MLPPFTKLGAILVALSALVVFPIQAAANGTSVGPTRLVFAHGQASTFIVVTNVSPVSQRYSVSAYRWDQTAANPIALSDTNDIVFFPGSFEIGSLQSQRIRVGTTAVPSTVENTYRLVVSELPPLQSVLAQTSGIGFTASYSIPIYVGPAAPAVPAATGLISDVAVDRNHLRFSVHNTGNVHFVVKTMHVEARGDSGTVMSTDSSAWFVLANSQRDFVMPLPSGDCSAIKSVSITVDADSAKFDRTVTPERKCG